MTDDVDVVAREIANLTIIPALIFADCGEHLEHAKRTAQPKIAAVLRAYGDQREREALERALSLIEAADWTSPQNIICVCRAIRALIPKGPVND